MGVEKPHLYKINDIIGRLKIIEPKRVQRKNGNRVSMTKAYSYKCLECGFIGDKMESTLKRNSGCPCCNRKVVVENINSIVANKETHWMIEYFVNGYDDAKKYTRASDNKVIMKCPHCGTLTNKPIRIADLYKRQSIGCLCNSGISYPERVGRILFPMIDSQCKYQYTPQWGNGKKYDFYLPQFNMIVELHGSQHYNPRGYMDKNISKNDLYKKELAKSNGVDLYYEIDCRESSESWIKNSLMTIKEIDWNLINFNNIFIESEKNIVKDVCLYYADNQQTTIKDICNKFNLSTYAIYSYLKKGEYYGWCVYDINERLSKQRKELITKNNPNPQKAIYVIKNDKILREYNSLAECVQKSKNDFGVNFVGSCISRVCNNQRKSYLGYVFKYK